MIDAGNLWYFHVRPRRSTPADDLSNLEQRISAMAVNTERLAVAIAAAQAKLDKLHSDKASLSAHVADLEAQIAAQPADTSAQDQAAVDAQAEALEAAVAKDGN